MSLVGGYWYRHEGCHAILSLVIVGAVLSALRWLSSGAATSEYRYGAMALPLLRAGLPYRHSIATLLHDINGEWFVTFYVVIAREWFGLSLTLQYFWRSRRHTLALSLPLIRHGTGH